MSGGCAVARCVGYEEARAATPSLMKLTLSNNNEDEGRTTRRLAD